MKTKILKHKKISVVLALSLIFPICGMIWAYFSLKEAQGPLIMHFSNLSGISQIGSVWNILSLGFVAIVAILFNSLMVFELEERDAFLGKFLVAGTLFFAILIFIGFAAIISVN